MASENREPWPISGLRFPIKRWETFCDVTLCRRGGAAGYGDLSAVGIIGMVDWAG